VEGVSIVVRSYDHGRSESLGDMGSRLRKLLTGLGAAHAKLTGWSARSPDGALVPVEAAHECADAIEAGARTWKAGGRKNVAYGPVFVAKDGAAEIGMVCGVEPQVVWTPNQVHLTLGVASGILAKDVDTLWALLAALAKSHEPAWGHVSIDNLPAPPMPPFADGAPAVGWMTFLSSEYRGIPEILPEPAVARLADKGTILVAHPSRPDIEAIARLRAALAEAGALSPAASIRKNER
jgi:hypothetical protein